MRRHFNSNALTRWADTCRACALPGKGWELCCAICACPQMSSERTGPCELLVSPGADLTCWTATTSQWQKHSPLLNCFYLFSPDVSIRRKLLHTQLMFAVFLVTLVKTFPSNRCKTRQGLPRFLWNGVFQIFWLHWEHQRTETNTIPCRALLGWLPVWDSTYFSAAPFAWSVPSSCTLCPVHPPTQKVSGWLSNSS